MKKISHLVILCFDGRTARAWPLWEARTSERMDCFCFLAVELSSWPLSEAWTSEKMGCFDVSANSIGVFSIRCSFKLFIYLNLFYFIFILSSQTFINRSVQHTFNCLHFILTALVLSCWDKFPMTSFWKFRWSRQFRKRGSTNIFEMSILKAVTKQFPFWTRVPQIMIKDFR